MPFDDTEYRREYRERNREKVREYQRKSKFKKKYGITLDDYAEMLEAQDGRCAICGDFPPHNKLLYVDHCHDTGDVRGLLCQQCNSGIGFLGDNVERVRKALTYLEKHV